MYEMKYNEKSRIDFDKKFEGNIQGILNYVHFKPLVHKYFDIYTEENTSKEYQNKKEIEISHHSYHSEEQLQKLRQLVYEDKVFMLIDLDTFNVITSKFID